MTEYEKDRVHLTDLGKAHLELTTALGLLEAEQEENDALRSRLAALEAELAKAVKDRDRLMEDCEAWSRLNADRQIERDQLKTQKHVLTKERDEWKACAERLVDSSHIRDISEAREAVEEFDRLKGTL